MSKEYAENKIREALKLHGNNTARARQHILNWANGDPKLLYALTLPHLDGIISYQVERVASGRAELERRHPEEKNVAQNSDKTDNFGVDLLRAVAGDNALVFGHEDSGTSQKKRTTASRQHIDAIHKIASSRHKFSKKKSD